MGELLKMNIVCSIKEGTKMSITVAISLERFGKFFFFMFNLKMMDCLTVIFDESFDVRVCRR